MYNSNYNLVRPGIILYGYESFEGALDKIDLRPISVLKSKVTFLKEVEAGTSIGYSRSYITNKKTKVATIPIGYADGFSRLLSNKGEVVIKGKKVPIIGSVCMDGFMADVTDIDVEVGDTVYLWDNENITITEGLSGNEQIIKAGTSHLQDGETVKTIEFSASNIGEEL